MSMSKVKLTLLSLLVSTSILSSSLYASEQVGNPVANTVQTNSKTFPEPLTALINAPGNDEKQRNRR